jgi:hypothetical protein
MLPVNFRLDPRLANSSVCIYIYIYIYIYILWISNCSLFRVQVRENRQGMDFGGFKRYLKDIWGNPSRAKIQ